MDQVNTKNTSNLEESAEILELSEEEEISDSVEQKRPRGSQTCLTPHIPRIF